MSPRKSPPPAAQEVQDYPEDLKRYRERLNNIIDSDIYRIERNYPVVIPDSRKYHYHWCKRSIGEGR